MQNRSYPAIKSIFTLLAFCFLAIGCAGSKPILYPNTHLQSVGQAQADQDIAECKEIAEQYVSASNTEKNMVANTVAGASIGAASGAVAGVIRGSAVRGSLVGAAAGATAGLARSLFRGNQPNPAYRNFINQCLRERGYQSVGWN